MINGINVLNKTEILTYERSATIGAIFTIIGVMTLIFLFVFLFFLFINSDRKIFRAILSFSTYSFVLLFFVFVILAAIYSSNIKEIKTGEYKYEVLIDDSVSLNSFYEKYEIIDTSGKIYTIKER